jgi:hypothetical protein
VDVARVSGGREGVLGKAQLLDLPQALEKARVQDRDLFSIDGDRAVNDVAYFHEEKKLSDGG